MTMCHGLRFFERILDYIHIHPTDPADSSYRRAQSACGLTELLLLVVAHWKIIQLRGSSDHVPSRVGKQHLQRTPCHLN